MSSYDTQWQEDARLAILAELAAQRDATLNSLNLGRVVDALGIRRPPEWVESQLEWLEAMGGVTLARIELAGIGPVLVATLTASGRHHVERRSRIAGVSAPADRR